MSIKNSLLAFLLALPAAAAAQDYGVAAYQTVRSCNGLAPTIDCQGPENPDFSFLQTYDSGVQDNFVENWFRPASGGQVFAQMEYKDLDLPTIKMGVWAGPDNRVANNLYTFMNFQFDGSVETPFALQATLDWTSSGSLMTTEVRELAGEGTGGFFMALLLGNPFADITSAATLAARFRIDCGAPYLALSYQSMVSTPGYHSGTSLLDTGCDGKPLLLQPGEEYTLLTFTQTVSNRGGWLDATQTITVDLAESLSPQIRQSLRENILTARASQVGAVPEPSTWAMLILGFGLVGGAIRKQKDEPAKSRA